MKRLFTLLLLLVAFISNATANDTEPANNDFAGADTLILGVEDTGKIQAGGDADYLKLNLAQCSALSIYLTNVPGINLEVRAYSAPNADSLIGYSGYGGNRLLEVLAPGGMVYLRISDRFGNANANVFYRLMVTVDSVDIRECNNTFATAYPITDSTSFRATMRGGNSLNGPVVDVDYYKVHVTKCGTLALNLENIPGINLEIRAYNAPHPDSLIGYSGYGGNRILELSPVPEYVYVLVSDRFSNLSSTGVYTLTVNIDTADPWECNNDFTTAAPVPDHITLTAKMRGYNNLHNPVTDVDYYKVAMSRCGTLQLSLINIPGINLELRAYSAPHPDSLLGYSGYGGNRTLEVTGSGGFVYVLVSDRFGDRSAAGVYTLTINLDTVDFYECNNNFGTASPVPANSTIIARIQGISNNVSDVDYYKVHVTQCGTLVLNLTNVPGINLEMRAYNAPHPDSLIGYSGYGGNRILELTPVPEYVYVLVSDRFGDRRPDTYTLKIEMDSIDTYECNNDFSTARAIPYNTVVTAKMRGYNNLHNPVSDVDIYKITLTKCGVLVFNLTNVTGINLQMHAYSADKTQLAYSGYGGNRSLEIMASPGDWYLQVSDRFGDRSPNAYTLDVSLDTSDACECNNTFADACTILPTASFAAKIRGVNAKQTPAVDVDYYKLTTKLCGQLTINLTNVPGINLQVTAYNATDTLTSIGYSGYGGNRSLTLNLLAGDYYLLVNDRFGDVRPDDYLMALNFTPIPAVPVVTASGPTSFCLGDSVVLTTSSIIPHKWNTLDSTKTITVRSRGVYTDTVRIINGCVAVSDPIIVEADSLPAVPTITPAGPISFCDGKSAILTSSAATANYWSTTENTSAITVTTAGSYIDTVKANANCYSVSAPVEVTVNPNPPVPVITPLGTVVVCEGQTGTLYSSVANGNRWSTGATTNSITVTQAGTYTDTVMNNFGCFSISEPAIVTNATKPDAGFTETHTNGAYNFTNTSTGETSYNWDFGDGNTSTDENPAHTYTTSGSKTVQLIVTNTCGSDTITQTLNVTTGINEVNAAERMRIKPNPCTTCEVSGTMDAADLLITDVMGRNCPATFTKTAKGYLIELPANASGVYLIQNVKTKEVVKFIKN